MMTSKIAPLFEATLYVKHPYPQKSTLVSTYTESWVHKLWQQTFWSSQLCGNNPVLPINHAVSLIIEMLANMFAGRVLTF